MIKRFIKQWSSMVFLGTLFMCFMILSAATDKTASLSEESQKCLKCHGGAHYILSDSASGDSVTISMYHELRIDQDKLLKSTHGAFKCTDCHSSDYETTPHPVSVKFESDYACLDCHGGDEAYASFNFETIDAEYSESVHAKLLGDKFNCWSCHNPHYYKLSRDISITDRVAIDNQMCLQCHGNEIKFSDLTSEKIPNLIDKHDWLPNQALHFTKVRCIDCHAKQNDSIMVAHMIQGGDKAVKNCVECHSTNTILLGSLYKFEVSQQRNEAGFYNGVILNQAYMISANRNYYLNLASFVIFGLTFLAVAFHAFLRYRKSSSNARE
ncbi:MAG TPA: cytochrome c3 family protein [Lentimicrobium sp.]|nr:cytochrome c3 family protein [Lentimicrobium sp.]